MQQQVETRRILELSDGASRLNRTIEDQITGLYNDLSRLASETRSQYPESTSVRSIAQNVEERLREIRDLARDLGNKLGGKAASLRQVAQQYEETERKLKAGVSQLLTLALPKVAALWDKQTSAASAVNAPAKPASVPTMLDRLQGLWLTAQKAFVVARISPYQAEPQTASLLALLKNGTPAEQKWATGQLTRLAQALNGLARSQVAYDLYHQYGNQRYADEVHEQAERYRAQLQELGVSGEWRGGDLRGFYPGSTLTACTYDPRFDDYTAMPTQLWSSGDGKLSSDKQVALLLLTNNYFGADTAEQREAIQQAARNIRDGTLSPYRVLGSQVDESLVTQLMQHIRNSPAVFPALKASIAEESSLARFANTDLASHPEEVRQAMAILSRDLHQAEDAYWKEGAFSEPGWWKDPDKLGETIQALALESAQNGGLSLPAASGNKLAAIQAMVGTKVTKEWGPDTQAAMQKMLTKSGVEGTATLLTPAMLKTMVERYSQGLQDDSIKWKQVGVGAAQTVGGFFEAAFGLGFATVTAETGVGVVFGGYVAVHGASNMSGGFSRIINGFQGSNAGDTANFEKYAFRAIGGQTGESIYNGIDMAVAFAQPMDLVAKTLYKGPAVALQAYKVPAAGRVMGVVEEKSEGAGQAVHIKAPSLPQGSEWERNVLNSFAGGKSELKTYGEGTTLYRIGDKNGGFWSTTPPPATEFEWRVNTAIKQEWGNNASNLYTMTVPKGSSISGLDGTVGSQGMGLYGGAHQVYIDFKAVPDSWITTKPLK